MDLSRQHIGDEEMKLLWSGMITYVETRTMNEHLAACGDCAGRYRNFAMSASERAPDEKLLEKCRVILLRDRRIAGAELSARVEGNLCDRGTIEGILRNLKNDETDRFMVTGGKVSELREDIVRNIEKLDSAPSLSPEGEKSFTSFLVRCVELNAVEMAEGQTEIDLDELEFVLEQINEVLRGRKGASTESGFIRELGEALDEKASALFAKFRKSAG